MPLEDLEGKKNYIISHVKNLHKYEQIQIFKICKSHKVKFSENGNGIFINLNYLEETILNQIILFIKFCIKNKTLLDKEIYKREELKKILSFNDIQTQSKTPESNTYKEDTDNKVHYESGFQYNISEPTELQENTYQEKNIIIPSL